MPPILVSSEVLSIPCVNGIVIIVSQLRSLRVHSEDRVFYSD